MIWQVIATVALWWVANTITSIASKSVMIGEDVKDESSWMPAFKELRWLELTALQHLVGAVASVVWLKAVVKTSLQAANTSKRAILMAALGNVTGNLATNAAYALMSSSTTQVIKACEPLFTLVLSLVLYKNQKASINMGTLISIVVMIAGACTFVLRDNSFNIWGLTAAIASNIAFPIRNIFWKKLTTDNSWENSFQNFAAISLYSVFLLLPVLVVKLAITQVLIVTRLDESIVSAVSHFTYNVASVTVLQDISPLTHAILNLSKSVFAIVANIVYFHTPMSFSMSMGLLVLFLGLFLYHSADSTFKKTFIRTLKYFLVFSFTIIICFSATTHQHLSSKPATIEKYLDWPRTYKGDPSTRCLTFLIEHSHVGRKRTDNVYLVDVDNEFTNLLPLEVQKKAINVYHNNEGPETYDSLAQFTVFIKEYAVAKLVITQRTHCALLCIAIGTPVIFIATPGMQTESFTRIDGLMQLFRTSNIPTEDAKQCLERFTWHPPPPNPNVGTVMKLRATAWNVIRQNQALYGAAQKYGLLPLSPSASKNDDQLVFHLIFATSKNDSIEIFGGGGNVQGFFNWRHWRSIESIFFHHPFAKVIIHSNTLLQSDFNVLTEAGYTIEVQGYSLEDLLKDSPAQNFIELLQVTKESRHWYSQETNLLRFLMLYKWGGVYMDTDVIIVRPVDSLKMNVIAWENPSKKAVGCSFMRFEKGHPLLKAYVKEFARSYKSTMHKWGSNGPGLFTQIWRDSYQVSSDVHVLDRHAFYMFFYRDVKEHCFNDTSGHTFDLNTEILREKAYAVHLNTKITGHIGIGTNELKEGTICKHLLNSYCVLCNEQH